MDFNVKSKCTFRKKWMLASLIGIANITYAEMSMDDVELELEDLRAVFEELDFSNDREMMVSGYGDVEYRHSPDRDIDEFRMHHLSLFFTKQFSDRLKFFSEIEYEDTPKFDSENDGTGDLDEAQGKIFVEAVNFDYFHSQEVNFRIGRFFTPAGIWSEDHYPPYVTTQERPRMVRRIFPQLTDGASLNGITDIAQNTYFRYNLYVGNGESGTSGKRDDNASKAFGLKLDLMLPIADEFMVGLTAYEDGNDSSNSNAERSAVGLHAKVRTGPFILQGEWGQADFDFDASSSDTSFERDGYYAQLIYKPNKFAVGTRFDDYEASDIIADSGVSRTSIFVNYQYSPSVVLKAEGHLDDQEGTSSNSYFYVFTVAAYFGE